MRPEKQNIAIAEACGWELKICKASGLWSIPPDPGEPGLKFWQANMTAQKTKTYQDWRHDREGGRLYPPDYLNDLNAMHEAEKVLFAQTKIGDTLIEDYEAHLDEYWPWNSTAAQRAEAFLRTIGKWEDE